MLKEFREFVMRGNVVDLAIAVIIGAAFGKIITSFVEDVLMPPIGLALGNVDFSNLFINLSGKDYPSVAAAKAARRRHPQLWNILQSHHQFSDHCVCDFFVDQANQPNAEARCGACD